MNRSLNYMFLGRWFAFLCVLSALCGELRAQDWRPVRDGVEYAELTRTISGQPVKMNLLRLNLKKVRLDVVHAMDMAIGTETVSSMAIRHGAFAAINAGFFRLDKSDFAGDAAGLLMIDGELLSESHNDRIALQIINHKHRTEAVIVRPALNAWIGSQESRFSLLLSGINREQKPNELIVYGSQFGRELNHQPGSTFIILRKCMWDKKWSMRSCAELSIDNHSEKVVVPNDGYVIAAGSEDSRDKELLLRELKNFQTAPIKKKRLYIRFEDKSDTSYAPKRDEDITNGVPLLIKNGKIDITWEQEKASKSFVETRHPRTAVAILRDGKFLMITIDGRSESSGGIGLYDLAALLLEFGAADAMNLDGGGSTTMYLDGKVVNKPSDKEGERKVSDAILVTLRKR